MHFSLQNWPLSLEHHPGPGSAGGSRLQPQGCRDAVHGADFKGKGSKAKARVPKRDCDRLRDLSHLPRPAGCSLSLAALVSSSLQWRRESLPRSSVTSIKWSECDGVSHATGTAEYRNTCVLTAPVPKQARLLRVEGGQGEATGDPQWPRRLWGSSDSQDPELLVTVGTWPGENHGPGFLHFGGWKSSVQNPPFCF